MNLTHYQTKLLLALDRSPKGTATIQQLAKELKRTPSAIRVTANSLAKRKLVGGTTRGARHLASVRLIKAGRVALVSTRSNEELERVLSSMTIKDIDALDSKTITNFASLLRKAKSLPKKAVLQLAEAVEKHGGAGKALATGNVVSLTTPHVREATTQIEREECMVFCPHATLYMQVNGRDGSIYGTGLYSQPYRHRNTTEIKPGIKACALSVLDEKLKKEVKEFIETHPNTTLHPKSNDPTLRIRFVRPVFIQVNLEIMSSGPTGRVPGSRFVLVGYDQIKESEISDPR